MRTSWSLLPLSGNASQVLLSPLIRSEDKKTKLDMSSPTYQMAWSHLKNNNFRSTTAKAVLTCADFLCQKLSSP